MSEPPASFDSHIMVFEEFLNECHYHPEMHPGAELVIHHHNHFNDPEHLDYYDWPGNCYTGSILKFGEGVIYRIEDYVSDVRSWHARWPD